MKLWTVVLLCALLVAGLPADAKRLGGGASIGKQSSSVAPRDAVKPAPTAAAPQGTAAAPAATSAPAAAPGAATPRPGLGMLGGLAAGLGLAWLANALGMGEAFGQFLLVALMVLVVAGLLGLFLRARRASASAATGLALQGAGAATDAAALRQYSPDKVGNDASARPWERSSMAFEAGRYPGAPAPGVRIGSTADGGLRGGVPSGFDADGFLSAAKRNFVSLQDAWDRADIASLRSMMTDEMVAEIRTQLAEREAHRGNQPNKTDVVMIDAHLLSIEDLGGAFMASVEFSGMIREEPSAGPSPFREVWSMTKPKDGRSGWLVGGVQALQ